MSKEILAEELRRIRKRYRASTFSLSIFVRDSLEAIDEKKDRLLVTLNDVRNVDFDEMITHLDRSGFDVAKFKTTIEMALADNLHIGEPHTLMLLEMSATYACALFDGLVSDVLIAAFRHIPEALRSGRTLTAEEVLGFSSREDIIEELARREALEVAYKSVESQFAYFQKTFKIDVFGMQSLDVTISDLTAVHERRNLIVHNNGLANASYAAKYPSVPIGGSVIVDAESAKSDREILRDVGLALIYSFHGKLVSSE